MPHSLHKRRLASLSALITVMLLGRSVGLTAQIAIGNGVTVDLPSEYSPIPDSLATITPSWMNPTGTLTIAVISQSYAQGSLSQMMTEFADWPSVGRTIASSFGRASAKSLGASLHSTCEYSGTPVDHDPSRALIRVSVDVVCTGSSAQDTIRTHLIEALTKTANVIIRVDSRPSGFAEADVVTARLWRSLEIAVDGRVSVTGTIASVGTSDSVSGGKGFHFTDYRLLRPTAYVAMLVGALLGSLVFGALLCLLFLRLGLKPLPALILAQIVLCLLRLWGAEEDGVWEVDWIACLLPGVLSVVLLHAWAKSRWEKRLARLQAPPDRTP